jgi:hypothetical protein
VISARADFDLMSFPRSARDCAAPLRDAARDEAAVLGTAIQVTGTASHVAEATGTLKYGIRSAFPTVHLLRSMLIDDYGNMLPIQVTCKTCAS